MRVHTLSSCVFFCLLIFGISGGLAGGAPEQAALPSEGNEGSSAISPATIEDEMEEDMRRAEIQKLQAEIESLRLQNEALDVQTRRWSAWLGAIGGITGAMLAFVVGLLGYWLNRLQAARTMQEKQLTLRRLEQESLLEREKQNLELYTSLGHDNPRVQFAAASVLLERLSTFRDRSLRHEELTEAEMIEHPTIILVLIAVIKERTAAIEINRALPKHIADNLVKALGAVVPEGQRPHRRSASQLIPYDWQNANLAEVWWESVDARGIDFFQANFQKAGLAKAFLQNAVFYDADLQNAVLRGAHLEGANFFGAQLDGAKLDGATYSDKTVWPEGFTPGPAVSKCGDEQATGEAAD